MMGKGKPMIFGVPDYKHFAFCLYLSTELSEEDSEALKEQLYALLDWETCMMTVQIDMTHPMRARGRGLNK